MNAAKNDKDFVFYALVYTTGDKPEDEYWFVRPFKEVDPPNEHTSGVYQFFRDACTDARRLSRWHNMPYRKDLNVRQKDREFQY